MTAKASEICLVVFALLKDAEEVEVSADIILSRISVDELIRRLTGS
ncbi:hypothetical protein AGR9A_Cc210491 [Agrobacterium salinitolerans str. Hayward 0363]|nr:hypothetical protein AGR9A_Cc210491 [Agrobacterium salinitolerans str. Hayward 0363]